MIAFEDSEKQKQEWIRFAHRAIFARFARSRGNFQHENIDFLGFKSFKSGFSEGLGATFRCVARRHSLRKYFDRLDILN